MADRPAQQGACPNLPSEVWKQILSHLPDHTDVFPHKLASDDLDDLGDEIWKQRFCLELFRVCHLFNKVMSEKPSYLVLIESKWDLEGLLNWFRRDLHRCQAVQHLVALGDSASLDIILGMLRVYSNCMEKVELREYTGRTLQLVSGFSTLKEFKLHRPVAGLALDLAPLQQLVNLENLTLVECTVSCLNAAGRLTRLELQECQATCSAHFRSVASLLALLLKNSHMQLTTSGLSACVSLTSLDFDNSSIAVIADTAESFVFDSHVAVVTSTLSSLSALTSLEMCLRTQVHVDAFQQITNLRCLQHLSLVTAVSYFKLSDCFSTLSGLKYVEFISFHCVCQLQFNLNWAGLTSLRSMALYGHFDIRGSFRGLVAVTAFQQLSLGTLESGDPGDMQLLGFATELGVLRPDVEIAYHISLP